MQEPDEIYMAQALELARRPAFTSPNPRVGCVVVREGEVIGSGWHEGSGSPHAEAVALDGVDATGATLYVNLEPCTHRGRTPPCAPRVTNAGVRRVVISSVDPDDRVAGRGIEMLRAAGIQVDVGILEDEARALNAPYLHHRSTRRSFVTLKLAMSLDGRMSAPDGSSRWITGPAARRHVHARRLEADAVMIGSGTAVADDPSLTVREVPAPRQPLRVVVDGSGRTPAGARLFSQPGESLIATTADVVHEAHTGWKEGGAEVLVLPASSAGVDLDALVVDLGRRGIVEIYCEGGPRLASSLLARDLVDRLEIHYGTVVLGGGGASLGDVGTASIDDARRWRTTQVARFDNDVVVTLEGRS